MEFSELRDAAADMQKKVGTKIKPLFSVGKKLTLSVYHAAAINTVGSEVTHSVEIGFMYLRSKFKRGKHPNGPQ